jgi:polyhydroxyalkanoate synthase
VRNLLTSGGYPDNSDNHLSIED